jgi:tRNA U55 pseudouridine synthase TruB
VRALAHDIGLKLGTGATLDACGGFGRAVRPGDAVTLDVAAQSDIEARILPLEALLTDWPAVSLTKEGAERECPRPPDWAGQCRQRAGRCRQVEVRFLGPTGAWWPWARQ